jgi:hypothetical protein
VSTGYRPWLQPCPYKTTATSSLGEFCTLDIPVRTGDDTYNVPEPETANPLPDYVEHTPAVERRWVEHDLAKRTTHYNIVSDRGDSEQPEHGLVWGET